MSPQVSQIPGCCNLGGDFSSYLQFSFQAWPAEGFSGGGVDGFLGLIRFLGFWAAGY